MFKIKYFNTLFVALMALGMSSVMSFSTTVLSQGFSHQFMAAWLSSAGVGFVVAFPAALIIAPLARRVATRLTQEV
jgi:hypothetical protein